MHSLLASWIANIFEWFEDVATIVCFIDHHDTILLQKINNVWDRALYGSERYPTSAYPINGDFDPFGLNKSMSIVPRR